MTAYWPGSAASERRQPAGPVAAGTLRRVVTGAAHLFWGWPGLVVAVVAYIAVAVPLAAAGHSYPNLWGGLAAGVVGFGWYASPLRRLEARRRQHLGAPPRVAAEE